MESQIELILLSILVGAVGLTLLTFLLHRPSFGAGDPFVLSFLIVVMATALSDLIDLLGLYDAYPLFEALVGPLIRGSSMLLAPIILFFVDRSTLARSVHRSFAVHAGPALIVFLIFAIVNAPDPLKALLFPNPEAATAFGRLVLRLFWLAFLLQACIYLARCFPILADHRQGLFNFFSTLPRASNRRLRILWAVVLLPALSIGIEFFFARLGLLSESWRFAGGALRILCLVALCALLLQAGGTDEPSLDEQQAGEVERRRKYARASLENDEAIKLASRLQRTMAEQGLHRNPLLSLSDVARAIRVPEHRLSQLLNVHLGTNFFDYVNGWRIKEAKSLLSDPSPRTVLDIAFCVGFNARSTFYNAFKKQEGTTPQAYRKASTSNSTAAIGMAKSARS